MLPLVSAAGGGSLLLPAKAQLAGGLVPKWKELLRKLRAQAAPAAAEEAAAAT